MEPTENISSGSCRYNNFPVVKYNQGLSWVGVVFLKKGELLPNRSEGGEVEWTWSVFSDSNNELLILIVL